MRTIRVSRSMWRFVMFVHRDGGRMLDCRPLNTNIGEGKGKEDKMKKRKRSKRSLVRILAPHEGRDTPTI